MTTAGDEFKSRSSSNDSVWVMPPNSKYAGLAIDVSRRRSIEIKPNDSGKVLIAENQSHVTVDNVYHDETFWRAIVPLDGVEAIFGQAFNFSKPRTHMGKNGREFILDKHGLPKRTIPFLNHLQTRITMKPEQLLKLYPMGCEDFGDPMHVVRDLVYSVETVGPPGIEFNLRDAFLGNFLSAHRFLSVQEMVFERLVVQNQLVTESPPLPLKDKEKRELLIRSLIRGHRAGMTETYYMCRVCRTSNCTSNPFQVLDSVVKNNWRHRLGSFLYRLPFSPRFYLRIRGLDSDPSFRKLVRTEFEDLINDDRVQKRKRTFVREQIRIRRAAQALLKAR